MKPQVQILCDGVRTLQNGRAKTNDDEPRLRADQLAEEDELGPAKGKVA